MQVTATTPVREHEKPMSWARAILIATGFFFITAILVAQLPGYIFTISTASQLTRFEQGTLDMGLLALGIGMLCFEISMLYDPRPVLIIFLPLFAILGAAIALVGGFFLYQVSTGGWPEFVSPVLWFQAESIDISAVGILALIVGLGMLGFAVLNPLVLSGRLVGPVRDLIVRFGLGLSIVIVALYISLYTFVPSAISAQVKSAGSPLPAFQTRPFVNIALFIALLLAIFSLQVWILPVMTANRSRFMPAAYLHGVVGLIGFIAVPLLIAFAIAYPLVGWAHGWDTQQVFVQCGQKTNIPGSCTFTPFTGYIICALAFGLPFTLLLAGLYFWSTRRDMVVLGGTIGIIFLSIALLIIHVDDPSQTALMLTVATGIAILAFIWTWATQREFAPTAVQQLGCVGQWLVLGTLMLLFLFGFSAFSLPAYFESESLALFYQPGPGLLHDAFWGILLMGGLAAFQFALIWRRRPMSDLRKFAMWCMLAAVGLMMVGAIQGFHRNVFVEGINAMEGSHAIFLGGICFAIVGIVTCLYGALRQSSQSAPWAIAIGVVVLLCIGFGVVIYTLSPEYQELIVFAFIASMAGAFAYVALGPDAPNGEAALANGNGAGDSFAITRP